MQEWMDPRYIMLGVGVVFIVWHIFGLAIAFGCGCVTYGLVACARL